MMFGSLRRDRPGGYALRRHRELRKAWQRRVFPRGTLYVAVAVAALTIVGTLLPDPFKTMFFVFGAGTVLGWWALREAFLPDHIRRWQRGSWGEEMTAKELKPLNREGWRIRHDIQTRRGNHDHIAIGNAVYLLETKYLRDSELSLEGDGLRVRRLDQPTDSYLMDHLTVSMETRGRALWRTIKSATGTAVYVYPVVVLWGNFPADMQHVRGVAFVRGEKLADWLRAQPSKLNSESRQAMQRWLSQYTGT